MRSIARTILLIAAFMFAAVAARADHMAGTYNGTDQAQGVTLQLQQSGRTVTGNLSGGAEGSLNGQSDGGDNASGTVELQGAGQFNFDGRWSQKGFNLTLIGSDGRADFFFASGSGSQPPQQQPPQQQPPVAQPPVSQPPPPPANTGVEYFLVENGVAAGPFTLDQVKQRLAEGRTRREDLIWKEGLADWVRIDTLPEFAQGGATPPPPPPANGGPKPPEGGQKPPEGGAKPPVLLSPGFPGRTK